jgi:hypothetical protein
MGNLRKMKANGEEWFFELERYLYNFYRLGMYAKGGCRFSDTSRPIVGVLRACMGSIVIEAHCSEFNGVDSRFPYVNFDFFNRLVKRVERFLKVRGVVYDSPVFRTCAKGLLVEIYLPGVVFEELLTCHCDVLSESDYKELFDERFFHEREVGL